ncbi:hypothetical protein NWP09_07100, partial [Agrococcus sp. HG114]|nr:hypothetical protein [Agrococcus sp. HG114]
SAPTLAWLAALLLAPAAAESLPLGPMLAESALALSAAVLLARAAAPAAARPLPTMLALLASSAVVATVTTAALAGTHAGRFAVAHGEHGAPAPAAPPLDVDEHGGH